jgi:exodeoxyribonuclease VII large subunit
MTTFQPSLFDEPPRVQTVSQINAYIRQKLEADFNLQNVWLEGEISNWNRASSGHIYFTLKDAGSSLRCVVWRSQSASLGYMPRRDGESVLAHGRISVYEAGGNYQFYVDDMEPVGQGALYARFERIKARLEAEGLFDESLKQPLPAFPRTIGVVTSPAAAAFRDILNVLRRRYPLATVILSPTQVQGETAPAQIIDALMAIMEQPVDVIIVARGGGSIEDLWAFNDEYVARAISSSPVPIVSGVGHQTDFTIADFVADVRAPTPSAAAELVSPDSFELKRQVAGYQQFLVEETAQRIAEARREVSQQGWALSRLSPQAKIDNHRQKIDGLTGIAARQVQHRLALQRQQLARLSAQLAALDPLATLSRGYAIIRKGEAIVTQIGQVAAGDELHIKLHDGEIDAIAQQIRKS